MKNLIQLFYNHITIIKATCLVLLFFPLWGLWWFNMEVGVGDVLIVVWIGYLLKSIPAAIVYTSVFLLAVVGFVIVAFICPAVICVPLLVVLLFGWGFVFCVFVV